MNSIELRQQRAKIVHDARELVDRAEAEKRELSADENDKWTRMMADVDALAADIAKVEKREKLDALEAEQTRALPRKSMVRPEPTTSEQRHDALRTWLLAGTGGGRVTAAQVRHAEDMGINLSSDRIGWDFNRGSNRALSHVGAEGGYGTGTHQPTLIEYLKWYCPIRNYADVITTTDGNEIPFATNDDTGNVGARIGENVAFSEQDISLGQLSLRAYTYQSKLIRIPKSLVEDSTFNLEDYVAKKLAERIGRIQEQEFVVTGTGSSMPKSLVTSASSGKTSFDVTEPDHWLDLSHAVDLAYRSRSVWVMHDSTVLALRKVEESTGRKMWVDGDMQNGVPGRWLGYPVVTSNSMATTGSGAKVVLFGDISQFIIRDVGSVQIVRDASRYMEYDQIAIVGLQRSDALFVGPSTSLKYGSLA